MQLVRYNYTRNEICFNSFTLSLYCSQYMNDVVLLQSSSSWEHDASLTVTRFQRSVPMSTYLVCFVVCDFAMLSNTTTYGTQVCKSEFNFVMQTVDKDPFLGSTRTNQLNSYRKKTRNHLSQESELIQRSLNIFEQSIRISPIYLPFHDLYLLYIIQMATKGHMIEAKHNLQVLLYNEDDL